MIPWTGEIKNVGGKELNRFNSKKEGVSGGVKGVNLQ